MKRAFASSDEESERESSSDNLSSSEESDDAQSDDANADDLCPRDCDNLIFEKAMELREKKIDKNLTETEGEIEKFQTEKQHFLNKIIVSLPLRLSQMRTKKLPSNIRSNK